MKFSILVPVYNVERYLAECIDSILKQSFKDYEIVLVDDGSTDSSGAICEDYANAYSDKIKVIHKKNQGLISARRVGINEAKGEFCVFVDSDDFVEKDLLETIEQYLCQEGDIDIVMYTFKYYKNGIKYPRSIEIANDGEIWDKERKKELYEKIAFSNIFNSIWTKAIRTSILKSDPTDYTLYYGKNMAEDLLQSLYPLTAARKVMYTDKVLYHYRINDESTSRSFYPDTIGKKNTIHVFEKVLEYLPVWNMDTKNMRDKVIAKWFNEAMYMMSQYYEFAKDKSDICNVLDYDWDSMMPPNACSIENKYENHDYQNLYFMWKNKDYKSIRRYFMKKKCYQKIKNIKRMLLG